MSRIWAASLVLLTITLDSGCVVSETIVVPKASEATIELLRVTPTPGSRVSRDIVIVAELSYRVDDFEAGRFFVMVQAATIEPEVTTMGKRTDIQQPKSCSGGARHGDLVPSAATSLGRANGCETVRGLVLLESADRLAGGQRNGHKDRPVSLCPGA